MVAGAARRLAFAALACVAWGAPAVALAEGPPAESKATSAVRLFRETGENTTVIDAFDEGDAFDANLVLGLRQQWKRANIHREGAPAQAGGGFGTLDVARFEQSLTVLDVGADVGIFRDLALSFRLPVILSDARELKDLNGSAADPSRRGDAAGETLFPVPFKSPTRSGVDYFSMGLDYAVLNQVRDASKPTWVIGGEVRVGIGERLHACNADAAVKCPDPRTPTVDRSPGISRGMNTFIARTVFSRRMGYVEPYAGLRFLLDSPQSNSDFGASSDLRGNLLSRPPVQGTFMLGMEIFPYEKVEAQSRLGFDLKLRGTYHSPGRDYSELFDPLGSSQARSLRDTNPAAYRSSDGGLTSQADPAAGRVAFAGITDTQAFGSVSASAGVTWQLNAYFKLTGGAGLTFVQDHVVTASDACNPDFKNDVGAAGPCRVGSASAAALATGVPNPNHRPSIDLPGRRFSVDDTRLLDLWLAGVVMF